MGIVFKKNIIVFLAFYGHQHQSCNTIFSFWSVGNSFKTCTLSAALPVQNDGDCNVSYTNGGNGTKVYNNAWHTALLCLKADIRYNKFNVKVMALMTGLPAGALFTFCVKPQFLFIHQLMMKQTLYRSNLVLTLSHTETTFFMV